MFEFLGGMVAGSLATIFLLVMVLMVLEWCSGE